MSSECSIVRLGDHITLVGGGTPSKAEDAFWNGGIPWATVKDLKQDTLTETQDNISQLGLNSSSSKLVKAGSLLIATRMAVGRVVKAGIDVAINQDLKSICCNKKLDSMYLYHFLTSKANYFNRVSSGATVKGIKIAHILDIKIPLPPLAEQKKIAAILDAADELRQKDLQLIDHYTTLSQSLFLEMFGDPVSNPMGWKKIPLRESSLIFSDGPFGSNLKSEHYTEKGVRVLRLQNIGVNHLVDAAKAYVSPEHYATISKHTCLPGDIVIATMGEPNIRSCIIPKYIDKAINKADCIQFRVDTTIGIAQYFNSLLNTPLFLSLVSHLLHGQTRTRISMGKLRDVKVPVPPIELQKKFSLNILGIEQQKEVAQISLEKSNMLFESLLQKAFKGELTSSKAA